MVTLSGIQDANGVSLFSSQRMKSALQTTRGGRIMEVIIRSPGNQLEEVVLECPDLTWHQVFCELHRLSRVRQVRLMTKGPGRYAVSSPAASNSSL